MSNAATRGVGGSEARESPQSSTRIRSGGGRRWSTCIKRWNVATLSPRRTQGDRRKPRERRHNPRSRRVGGAGKSSVLHPKAQRRRQAVERMHQAVERHHALPQAEGRHRAANPKATGGSPVSDAATRGIGGSGARESLSPPLESAAEAADGGAHASSGRTSPHSPPGEGETPRDRSAHNPTNRRVGCRGGSKSPRVPAPASGAAVAPPKPPTIDGASGQSVAKPRRGGADIRPREWPDAPPKRAVRAWPWATVRSRREKAAPPPCPRVGGRCGVNESMWTSGKNLT